MNIFKEIGNSIYNPAYYKSIAEKPLSYSLKYFFFFALIVALVFSVFYSFVFMPKIQSFLDFAANKLINYYPSELVVTVKDGQASANVDQPYFLKAPQALKAEENSKDFENMLVVDTQNQFDMQAFTSYKTLALLNKDTIALLDENGAVKIQTLKDVPDVVINKSAIEGLFGKIKPLFRFVYPLAALGLFLAGYAGVILKFIYLIFGALLVWAVSSVKKNSLGYKKSYRVGLHLVTGPIILALLLGFAHYNFAFLFSLLLILSAAFNLSGKNMQTEPSRQMQAGQASRMLLILAIVILVASAIVFLVMKMAEKPPKPVEQLETTPMPVYEQKLGDIRFVFMSAIDYGNTLLASNALQKNSNQKDLQTTGKFIKVTIGAQNKGKIDTEKNSWDLGDIVDSEGRYYSALKDNQAQPWISEDDLCGAGLKPEFDPVPCTKIYEVSKISTGLKTQVLSGKNNSANNFSSKKTDSFLMDLIVK